MIRVDVLRKTGKRVFGSDNLYWAHMWEDIGDRDYLEEFAESIGLKIRWIQLSKNPPLPELEYHFDITRDTRRRAIEKGAKETDLLSYVRQKKGDTSEK